MNNQLQIHSFAIGVGTKNHKGEWLEAFFPKPMIQVDPTIVQEVGSVIGWNGSNQSIEVKPHQIQEIGKVLAKISTEQAQEILESTTSLMNATAPCVVVILIEDAEPQSVPEIYLKLHLLSHRLFKPHQQNLAGIFGKLPNVAWTNEGAIDLSELSQRQVAARAQGKLLQVFSVDKFPKLTDYVVPTGVRIADTARVRLGAYLGTGTTIMHEGFVNFNAGTEGPNMVEGRISAGVMVRSGSDLGGGCSTMGTLSGGNQTVISVGKDCLIGANAGLGIPLGDRCTIEAGLYVTAASKVSLIGNDRKTIRVIKASELSGKSDLLFRRNSQTGAIEALSNKSAIELNSELHTNN